MSLPEKLMSGVRSVPRRRQRIACSGWARHVLDHIDREERLSQREQKTWTIPFAAGKWATLNAPYPIEQDEWDRMMLILDSMKEGLIDQGVLRRV